jgi:hypothetical protein
MKFCIFTCKIKSKDKYTCLKIMKNNEKLFSLRRGRGWGMKHSRIDIGGRWKAI